VNNRIKKCVEVMKHKNIEALLLNSEENVRYITGFTGDSSWALITYENTYLFTDGRFIEQAKNECEGVQSFLWQNPGRPDPKTIEYYLKLNNINNVGFEAEKMSYGIYSKLIENISKVSWIGINNIVEDLRSVKDLYERECLLEACRIADKGLEKILPLIKIGATEKDIANELVYAMKKEGAEKEGFDTICISGKKTSMPHGQPDNKKIQKGDFLTIDFGALYKGYTSDMTRTFVIGKASEEQIEVYNLVKEAQKRAVESIKSGIKANIPDIEVRKVFGDKYIKYYYPGMGHGVGLFLHEKPFISINSEDIIKEDTIMTVEPGLYIPNWGGVRIEDCVHVTKDSAKLLTHFDRNLIEL